MLCILAKLTDKYVSLNINQYYNCSSYKIIIFKNIAQLYTYYTYLFNF